MKSEWRWQNTIIRATPYRGGGDRITLTFTRDGERDPYLVEHTKNRRDTDATLSWLRRIEIDFMKKYPEFYA